MKLSTTSACLAGAIALAAPMLAPAQSTDYGRWDDAGDRPRSFIPMTSYGYVGLSLGQATYDLNCVGGFECDDKDDIAGKLYTGGKFSRMLGLELAYVWLGEAQANGGSTEAQLANLSLVGNVPIGERFNAYAKVGAFYGWTDVDATAPGVPSGEENDLGLSYGLGVQFDINRNWAVTGDWDHYRVDFTDRSDDVQLWSLGVLYKF
jgi:opacity protein-like surface antigen